MMNGLDLVSVGARVTQRREPKGTSEAVKKISYFFVREKNS